MTNPEQFEKELERIIRNAVREDIGPGDYSSLASVPAHARGKARLLVKDSGIIAGVEFARRVFRFIDPELEFTLLIPDGKPVEYGDEVFYIQGKSQSILKAERIVLNAMQRMSAIATKTRQYVQLVDGFAVSILDTRKTTPGIRAIEKWAVRIGGGTNHRFGLYDMIMLKDNHIDFAGGIKNAIYKTVSFLKENNLALKIEIETRNLDEVREVLEAGHIHRIMLDNFSYEDLKEAVKIIGGRYETEASGGITEKTIAKYAACGVDYISSGALTHSVSNMDLSLKAF